MSNDNKKNVIRLVPGEPVPQFGGMTPEQMAEFAGKIESIVIGTFHSADGAMTLYSHLACRLLLEVEAVAGVAAVEVCIETLNAAIRDELKGQRSQRALDRERDAMTNPSGEVH